MEVLGILGVLGTSSKGPQRFLWKLRLALGAAQEPQKATRGAPQGSLELLGASCGALLMWSGSHLGEVSESPESGWELLVGSRVHEIFIFISFPQGSSLVFFC